MQFDVAHQGLGAKNLSIDRILTRVIRIPGVKGLWERCPVGSVAIRTRFDIWKRPYYAYGIYAAATLAKALRLKALSVVEFGVAGGRGLLEMENIAQQVSAFTDIRIAIFGFDSGVGMPDPVDYRDLPHIWAKGYYKMDQERLRARLKTARLLLGDLEATVSSFINDSAIEPVGFVAFDLDYYSSTKKAFALFDNESPQSRLPRVYCYFDDIIWPEIACYNPHVGELCAISEFNQEHSDKKICPLHKLRNMRVYPAGWNDQMYILHDFRRPLYCENIGSLSDTQMPLSND